MEIPEQHLFGYQVMSIEKETEIGIFDADLERSLFEPG